MLLSVRLCESCINHICYMTGYCFRKKNESRDIDTRYLKQFLVLFIILLLTQGYPANTKVYRVYLIMFL